MSGVRFSQDPPVRPRRSGAVFGFRALWTATETTPSAHAGAVRALSASRRRAAASEPVLAPRSSFEGSGAARLPVGACRCSRPAAGGMGPVPACVSVCGVTPRESAWGREHRSGGEPQWGGAPMGESPNGGEPQRGRVPTGEHSDGWTASRVWTTEGRETPKSVLWPAGCHRILQRPTVEV